MIKINERRGISLVALIITIIVLIILTGTVIVTMNQGDIIGKSEEAVFKHDVTTYREELVRIKMEEQLKRETGEATTLNLSPGVSDLAAKKDILSSFKDEYNDVLLVENGDLKGKFELLTSDNEQDKLYSKWLQEVDIPIAWNNEQAGDFTITAEGVLTSYNGSERIVIIPDTVTSIENNVFWDCTDITSIIIPDSVTYIGSGAFFSCISLTNITIPDSVTTISDSAYFSCVSLTNITIPDSVTTISDSAYFSCVSLTNITIPDSVTRIGMYAFSNCSSLANVTITNTVTSIDYGAFENCTNANFIVGSEGVKTLILNSESGIAAEKITVDPSVN